MKQGTLVVKIVTWVFFLSAVAYFGVYTAHVLFSGYETGTLYSTTAEDTLAAAGVIVRSEEALKSEAELTEIVAAEGETIGVGDTIAMIYDNEEALDRDREISKLNSKWESLSYIRSHSTDSAESATLNQHIIDSIVALRAGAANGNVIDISDRAQELKTLMFRRDYTYNGSNALLTEISDVIGLIEGLSAENRSYTKAVVSPKSGIFSSLVDGYELVLTPKAVKDLTPKKYDKLLSEKKEVAEGAYMGKLVTGAKWYFATVLDEQGSERLKADSWVSVRFNSMARVVRMKVQSVSKPTNEGKVCVVFVCDHYLAETTLLRDQTVDIIFNTVEGFRVPKSGVFVENQTGEIGVYRVYGAQTKWIPVETVWEADDYYLVRQAKQYDSDGNELPLSELDQARQLREGVEVVVKGTNLYDGKVVK